MSNVYELRTDHEGFSHFLEVNNDVSNCFAYKYWEWKNIDPLTYEPLKIKLHGSDYGKINYKMDITKTASCLLILSERAVECLKELLEQIGQIIPVVTDSKRKKFYGFYPNKNPYNLSIVNMEKTDYRQAAKGKIFHKIVLNNSYPKDDYIFTLKEEPMMIFATDKFKKLVEKNNLGGLSFHRVVEVSE